MESNQNNQVYNHAKIDYLGYELEIFYYYEAECFIGFYHDGERALGFSGQSLEQCLFHFQCQAGKYLFQELE
jgi:hypothetical protein